MYSILYSWLAAIVLALTACAVGVGKEQTSGDPRAKTAMKHAVADPEHDVRLAAAKVPAEMKDSAILDELIAGLDRDDLHARNGSVLALVRHSNARAFDALMARCKQRNFAFRWQVGEAIANAANRAFIPMMLDAVNQGADWRVQEVSVVVALALMHDDVGIDPLLQSLRSDDRYIRRIACWQLGLIGEPRAIDALIRDMLEKYDTYEDRVWGASAISRIGARLEPPVPAIVSELAHGKSGKIETFKQMWTVTRDRYLRDKSQ